MSGFPGAGFDEADRLRVLRPRTGWRPEEWEQIPALSYVRKATGDGAEIQLKLFLRWFMAAVDATIGETVQFVMLFRLDQRPDGVEYHVICPYDAPLRLMLEAQDRGIATRELLPRAAGMEIDYRLSLLADKRVPIVVSYDAAEKTYAFDNRTQINDPDQFLSPQQCRTTSGFLNFVGASEIRGGRMMMVSNLDELKDQGLDEWLRWLYCVTETGVSLDGARLLVRRDAPESWVYDYDGSY